MPPRNDSNGARKKVQKSNIADTAQLPALKRTREEAEESDDELVIQVEKKSRVVREGAQLAHGKRDHQSTRKAANTADETSPNQLQQSQNFGNVNEETAVKAPSPNKLKYSSQNVREGERKAKSTPVINIQSSDSEQQESEPKTNLPESSHNHDNDIELTPHTKQESKSEKLQKNPISLQEEITSLQKIVASLQGENTSLQEVNASLQKKVASLQGEKTSLQEAYTTLNRNYTLIEKEVDAPPTVPGILKIYGQVTNPLYREEFSDWLWQSCCDLENHTWDFVSLVEVLQQKTFDPSADIRECLAKITCSSGAPIEKAIRRLRRHPRKALGNLIMAHMAKYVFQHSFPPTELFEIFEILKLKLCREVKSK